MGGLQASRFIYSLFNSFRSIPARSGEGEQISLAGNGGDNGEDKRRSSPPIKQDRLILSRLKADEILPSTSARWRLLTAKIVPLLLEDLCRILAMDRTISLGQRE